MRQRNERAATVVVDLGYGDSGKGSVTDWLCAKNGGSLVVRFNGGSQAAHGVRTPDGRRHVFSQFGSGSLTPGVRTLLSRHMLISPLAMLSEARALREAGAPDAFERTAISEEALVITPFQRAANRLRELARGDGRHGSCGHGVGETASDALRFGEDALRMRHLRQDGLAERLRRIQDRKREELQDVIRACRSIPDAYGELSYFDDLSMPERWVEHLGPFLGRADVADEDAVRDEILSHDRVVFEGAQGVLLDEWRGFHPYTTWSTCTFDNALDLLKAYGWEGAVAKLGVVRGYATRHGAGPFPTEDARLTRLLPDDENVMNDWQRGFRVGWLDLVAIRYAIKACGGIDALAVTCLDRLLDFEALQVCDDYETPEGRVHDLELGVHMDLAHQERLTSLLSRATPKFRRTTPVTAPRFGVREHARAIHFMLGGRIPSLLISTGPTSHDKEILL